MNTLGEGIVRIGVLIVIGATVYTVVSNPKGTSAVFGGVGSLWRTGLSGVTGRNLK